MTTPQLIGSRLLGIIIMVLFTLTGIVMASSPGSIRVQKPEAGVISWLSNVLNLFIVLVVTPLVAVLLMMKATGLIETTSIKLAEGWPLVIIETLGILFFLFGNLLLYWGRVFIGGSFRLGGVAPRPEDKLVTTGPYRLVRHPMYTAVLFMDLGLALLIQSLIILILFVVLFIFVKLMIPEEEAQL